MRRGTRLLVAGPMALALLAGLLVPARAVATSHAPVVLIVMENQSFGSTDPGVNGDTTRYIVGNPDAPYINGTLIPAGTLYTNYHALGPVSLPNYLDLTAGTDGGCTTNSCPPDSFPQENLFHLLGEAGIPFASFIGGMPGKCPTSKTYPSLRHNPEAYFTNVDASTGLPYACPITDVPLPSTLPNPLPNFTLIAPSNCDNMHGAAATSSCPAGTDAIIQAGDSWLSHEVPALLALGATVVVTFDEGSALDTSGGGGHVVTIVVGPDVPAGAVNGTPVNHFGLLAGIERTFGLSPLLSGAATATPIQIPDGPAPSAPEITDVTPSSGGRGTMVRITGTSLGTAGSVDFDGVPAAFTIPQRCRDRCHRAHRRHWRPDRGHDPWRFCPGCVHRRADRPVAGPARLRTRQLVLAQRHDVQLHGGGRPARRRRRLEGHRDAVGASRLAEGHRHQQPGSLRLGERTIAGSDDLLLPLGVQQMGDAGE